MLGKGHGRRAWNTPKKMPSEHIRDHCIIPIKLTGRDLDSMSWEENETPTSALDRSICEIPMKKKNIRTSIWKYFASVGKSIHKLIDFLPNTISYKNDAMIKWSSTLVLNKISLIELAKETSSNLGWESRNPTQILSDLKHDRGIQIYVKHYIIRLCRAASCKMLGKAPCRTCSKYPQVSAPIV